MFECEYVQFMLYNKSSKNCQVMFTTELILLMNLKTQMKISKEQVAN